MIDLELIATATRPIYWHISNIWVLYVLMVVAVSIFGYGIWRRVAIWRKLGKPAFLEGTVSARLKHLWRQVGQHDRFLRDRNAGLMHMAIMWGMVLLFAGTLVVILEEDFGIPLMHGWFYLIFQKLVLNIAGVFLVLGLLVALVRRYGLQVKRLAQSRGGPGHDFSDVLSLLLPLLILLQGFEIQAIRLAVTGDVFALWSPVGYVMSLSLSGFSEPGLIFAYQISWWFHLVTVLAWIAWLPYSKMLHIFLAPANVMLGNIDAQPRRPKPILFDDVEHLGVSHITDMSWKDMLDLDACVSCGRCEAACPVFEAGGPLSPRNLILDARDHMRRDGPAIIANAQADNPVESCSPALVGDIISEETLWSCLTCGACVQECPIHVEHVPKVIDMRRFLTMEKGDVPETLQDSLKSLEDRGHPYPSTRQSRTDWAKGLDILRADQGDEFDVLYWVGCTAAFDPRAQKVARSFVQLMQMADIKVAILGDAESCCGDPARRMGHEYIYDMMARDNVKQLKELGPKKIVTACPHCFNALGKEYRDFGGEFDVMHHTQMLSDLVSSGKIETSREVKEQVTYHDPCYLGRYNGEFEAPRETIGNAGCDIVEMERSRSKSFCCGGGGGHAFMAATGDGPRVNQLRAIEAVETGAQVLATSCPFCLRMMEDGVGALPGQDKLIVRDVAELLFEATQQTAPELEKLKVLEKRKALDAK